MGQDATKVTIDDEYEI